MISPDSVPDAPWILHGEAIAMLASPLCVRLLVNYRDSPVGAYREHALAQLTRRGPHVFQMSVDLRASMLGGRQIWGFPKTIEDLAWQSRGNRVVFRRESHSFRLHIVGPGLPLSLAFWTIQQLNGADVRVPGYIQARAKLAFRGRQMALYIEDFRMKFEPPVAI